VFGAATRGGHLTREIKSEHATDCNCAKPWKAEKKHKPRS
jgi:hypothetical protein